MTLQEAFVDLLARRPDISQASLAAYAGLSVSTINRLMLTGEGFGRRAELELERVLKQIEAGDILQPGGASLTIESEPRPSTRRGRRARNFYLNQTVARVDQMLSYCAENGVIGITTGEYGVGKTEAIRRWLNSAGRSLNTIVFEFDEFSSRQVVDFVNQLAERLNVHQHDRSVRRGGETMRAICAAINAQEHPLLLILDQCEACSPRVLQIIRQVWDKTKDAGCGVAIFASPLLLQRLHATRMRDVGALSSRVAIWAQLTGVLREEVMDILAKEGVKDIETSAMDLLWRASGGSMRRLMAAADLLVAKHAGKKITDRTIEGVAAHLWGMGIQGRTKAVA